MPGAALPSDAAVELKRVRYELDSLRRMVADTQLQTQLVHLRLLRAPVRHGWMKYLIKDFETNPRTQYKVHLYGAVYWLANFPLVIALFFFAPGLWLKLGIFITLIYSIYSNFATDYGGMSAAMASFGQALPEIPGEPPGGSGSAEGPPDCGDGGSGSGGGGEYAPEPVLPVSPPLESWAGQYRFTTGGTP